MRNYTKTIFIISAVILTVPLAVWAHQPRLVEKAGIVIVKNPEVSQSFYGELEGQYRDFKIDSGQPFNLYAGILAPDLPEAKTDLSLEIFQLTPATTSLAFLEGERFNWSGFYEPFAGDKYLQGPEFSQAVEPGQYLIRVASVDFKGKYSLVIGEKESFPLSEIWNTLKILPTLKKDFFNKSVWAMFFNYIGLFLLIVVLILAMAVFLAWRGIRRFRNK